MCGIFGSINATPQFNRTLSVLNQERGAQGFGAFRDDHEIKKWGDPVRSLILKGTLDESFFTSRVFLGHTRAATHGSVSAANAHPFLVGPLVGAHNGIVYNFETMRSRVERTDEAVKAFEVDSQLLLWVWAYRRRLLKKLSCYAGMWWVDTLTPALLHLWSWDAPLSYARTKDAFMFSSDADHLKLAGIPANTIKTMSKNGAHLILDTERLSIVSLAAVKARGSLVRSGGAWLFDEDDIDDKDWEHWARRFYGQHSADTPTTARAHTIPYRMSNGHWYCSTCRTSGVTYMCPVCSQPRKWHTSTTTETEAN